MTDCGSSERATGKSDGSTPRELSSPAFALQAIDVRAAIGNVPRIDHLSKLDRSADCDLRYYFPSNRSVRPAIRGRCMDPSNHWRIRCDSGLDIVLSFQIAAINQIINTQIQFDCLADLSGDA